MPVTHIQPTPHATPITMPTNVNDLIPIIRQALATPSIHSWHVITSALEFSHTNPHTNQAAHPDDLNMLLAYIQQHIEAWPEHLQHRFVPIHNIDPVNANIHPKSPDSKDTLLASLCKHMIISGRRLYQPQNHPHNQPHTHTHNQADAAPSRKYTQHTTPYKPTIITEKRNFLDSLLFRDTRGFHPLEIIDTSRLHTIFFDRPRPHEYLASPMQPWSLEKLFNEIPTLTTIKCTTDELPQFTPSEYGDLWHVICPTNLTQKLSISGRNNTVWAIRRLLNWCQQSHNQSNHTTHPARNVQLQFFTPNRQPLASLTISPTAKHIHANPNTPQCSHLDIIENSRLPYRS